MDLLLRSEATLHHNKPTHCSQLRFHEMSEKRIKAGLHRVLELIDGEAHKRNTTITDGAYVQMLNELLAVHKEASHANAVKKMIFDSKVLEDEMSVTSTQLCAIDSFVDSVQHIMRIERNIEQYKSDILKWNNEANLQTIQKYEEDAVISFVIRSRLNSYNLDSFEIKSLKKIGIQIENEQQFLQEQFSRLQEWYDTELRLEYVGLQASWSILKTKWSEFENVYKFIQHTFEAMEYIRTYKKFKEFNPSFVI